MHSDKEIMSLSDTRSDSRELPSPHVVWLLLYDLTKSDKEMALSMVKEQLNCCRISKQMMMNVKTHFHGENFMNLNFLTLILWFNKF